jgi:hypothetical protein
MSAQNDTGTDVPNDSCTEVDKNTLVARFEELESKVDDQSETIEELESKVDEQSETIEELEGKVNELEDDKEDQAQKMAEQSERMDDLEERASYFRGQSSKDLAETKQRVETLEQTVGSVDGATPDSGEAGIQQHELTPIEQLACSDDVDEVTNSPSVKRAVALFKNIDDWGSKTPKGIVLKSADNPLSLLSADQDESLCWKQYYRAAQTLESLSKGSVTFVSSDRHGKMVILHEQSEAYSRMINGTLTTSSAHEKA